MEAGGHSTSYNFIKGGTGGSGNANGGGGGSGSFVKDATADEYIIGWRRWRRGRSGPKLWDLQLWF